MVLLHHVVHFALAYYGEFEDGLRRLLHSFDVTQVAIEHMDELCRYFARIATVGRWMLTMQLDRLSLPRLRNEFTGCHVVGVPIGILNGATLFVVSVAEFDPVLDEAVQKLLLLGLNFHLGEFALKILQIIV